MTDRDIAHEALAALRWNAMVPHERITVSVANGRLTLGGTLDWPYQKDAAARAVRHLAGVTQIVNRIAVQPRVQPADVRAQIEAEFRRSAEIDARRINVTAGLGGRVILSGHVRSWAERQEAERGAWAAPGVTEVEDRLVIMP